MPDRVYKHAAINENSPDLNPFNRKLALSGIIPNQILFSFSSDTDRRIDSRIRQLGESREFTRSSCCGFVAQWLECATRIRKTLGLIPGGAALCFSSDPAVSFSIFVGAEREENLIRNDPDNPYKMIPTRARSGSFLIID